MPLLCDCGGACVHVSHSLPRMWRALGSYAEIVLVEFIMVSILFLVSFCRPKPIVT